MTYILHHIRRNKENLKIVIVSIAEIIISYKYKIQNPKEKSVGRIFGVFVDHLIFLVMIFPEKVRDSSSWKCGG